MTSLRSTRRSLYAASAVLLLAGCSAAATGSPPAPSQTPSAGATVSASQPPVVTLAPATPGPTAAACASQASGVLPHQAPEIEAVLPATVSGRPMARWSVRGECWLELAFNNPTDIAQFMAAFTTAANPHPNDPSQLVYGVDGRSNTTTDPPYFVYAALRPQNNDEIALAIYLLTGGAGYVDPSTAADLSHYKQQTVAGKQVYVGTLAMLGQDTHQRGVPYLYETDRWLFLVITEDPTWATDAIGQLP